MIRARQRLNVNAYYAPIMPRVDKLDNGKSAIVYKDEAADVLPDADTTKLSALLGAGVDLRQVPTKILPMNEMVTEFSPTEKSVEPENNNKE